MQTSLIGAILGLVFGLVVSLLGILSRKETKNKEINCTSKTYGKVINIVKHQPKDKSSSPTLHPVFEYVVGEQKFTNESSSGSSICRYSIGQNVEIYYNPKNYSEYYVEGDNTQKFVEIYCIIIGALFIILSLVAIILKSLAH